MPGKITKNFRLHSARQFYEQFSEAEPSNLYFFIARPQPWDNELIPPTPIDSTSETTFDIWDNMLSLKKISPADVSFGVDRVDWTSGTTYSQYTSDTEFWEDNDFFVITEDFNVYKCLYNNLEAASTVKPFGTGTDPIYLNDGYVWKYMYTIVASDALKFSTTRMIPVKTLTSDDGSMQWDVQQAAVDGSIQSILIDTGGTGYKEHTGTLATGGSTTATLASSANSINGIYNGSTIYISSGTGAGQLREITNYNGSTKVVTVNNSFSPSVDGTSIYVVSPKITLVGDGKDTKAYSRVVGTSLSKVLVINPGSDYTYADVSISASTGTGATATAQIAPVGGHGKDAVSELFAHNIIMNVKMTGNESNTFIVANDFRTVGILADPIEYSSNTVADDISYNQTMRLTLDEEVDSFSTDETITGTTSGATSYVVEYFSNNVISVTGGNRLSFENNETITGTTSGATAKIVNISYPSLKKYEGKLLYVENRSPVSRSADQQEDVKILLRF